MPKPSLILPTKCSLSLVPLVSPMLFWRNFNLSLNWGKECFMAFSASPSSYKMETFTPVYSRTVTMWTQTYWLIMLPVIWHSISTYNKLLLGVALLDSYLKRRSITINSFQSIRLVMRHIFGYYLYPKYPKTTVSITNTNQVGIVMVIFTIDRSSIMPKQHMRKPVYSPITSPINIIEPVGEQCQSKSSRTKE